ncbi:MAG: ABC transporter substrate-binding protein [Ilumatobacteraceae bacterium]
MTLRVALIGGPMYDHLDALLDEFDVEVVVRADHPTLNRTVAKMLAAGERLDLLSTHSKYAPSQSQWLTPLDGVVDTESLAPLAVELCRDRDVQWCVPRLIDVRIMWLRTDRVKGVPDTWQDVIDRRMSFGFPGRESGLFGTFFELVVGGGGRLFDEQGRPTIDGPEAIEAVRMLCALAAKAPADLPTWHYDQVDAALLDGRIDAAGVWPGGWGPIRERGMSGRLTPHPYPSGPVRRVSYSGCHGWAIPSTCGDLPGATALLRRLTGPEAGAADAAGGNVCANLEAFAAVEPVDDVDAQRLAITAATIESAMITYPAHPRFPELEDGGWAVLNEALRGLRTPAGAVREIQSIADRVMR